MASSAFGQQAPGSGFSITYRVHLTIGRLGKKELRAGQLDPVRKERGRVPRLSRLMALAIRFESLIEKGEVRGFADLARLGSVSRARISQIMNLLNLAPDIQEEILFLSRVMKDRDPITEHHIRPVASAVLWAEQREVWGENPGAVYERESGSGVKPSTAMTGGSSVKP